MRCNLEVLDFYASKRFTVNNLLSSLITMAPLYILIKEDGEVKEISFTVPKKYVFMRRVLHVGYINYKADEYNVLVDYVLDNKQLIKDKYSLTNKRFNEIVRGLKYVLDSKYTSGNKFIRKVKKCLAWLDVNIGSWMDNVR